MEEYLEAQRLRTGRPYFRSADSSSSDSSSLFVPDSLHPRRPRHTYITTCNTEPERILRPKHTTSNNTGILANSRDNALRFLRSVISANPKSELVQHLPERTKSRQEPESPDYREDEMRSHDLLRAARSSSAGVTSRPAMSEAMRVESNHSTSSNSRNRAGSVTIPEERPVASGNGVSVSLNLAEPVLFLQGFEHGDSSNRSTAMLRGHLHLKIAKNVKLKAVTLKFKGTATTKWPEGESLNALLHDVC